MQAFNLTEKDLQPRCREILVEGELDLAVADQLKAALDRAMRDCTRILIGLEDCEFIDSTGISVILRAHNQMAKIGRQVAIYGPSNQVLRILSVTGLTNNGLVFEKADEALSVVAEGS